MSTWLSVATRLLDAPGSLLVPRQSARVTLDGPLLREAVSCDIFYRGYAKPIAFSDPSLFHALANLLERKTPEMHRLSVGTNFTINPDVDFRGLADDPDAAGWMVGWLVVHGGFGPIPADMGEIVTDARTGEQYRPADEGVAVYDAWHVTDA